MLSHQRAVAATMLVLLALPGRVFGHEIPGVKVIGGSTCPAADEVAAELVGLVPSIPAGLSPDVAEVRPGLAGGLVVRLARASGKTVGERQLAEEGSCRERARTAAVIIASWETSLPETGADAPRLPPPVVVPTLRPAKVSVGISALAAIDAHGAALAAAAEITREVARGAGFLRAGLSWDGNGAAVLGPGTISWWRAGVRAGGGVFLGRGAVSVELGAAALLTMLGTDASGYPMARSMTAFDPGLLGSARLLARGDALTAWLGVEGVWWAQKMVATIQGLDGRVEVPDRQLLVGAGVELRIR